MNKFEKIEEIKRLSQKKKRDLSSDQDLSIALMNLISIEEHFIFSGNKTGKSEYYHLGNKVREIRKSLLKELVTDYEGEVWCISKHLLAASMRLIEVGTKQLDEGNEKKAEELFSKSYDLYSLFWAVNDKEFNAEKLSERKKESSEREPTTDDEDQFLIKLKAKVSALLDCCRE